MTNLCPHLQSPEMDDLGPQRHGSELVDAADTGRCARATQRKWLPLSSSRSQKSLKSGATTKLPPDVHPDDLRIAPIHPPRIDPGSDPTFLVCMCFGDETLTFRTRVSEFIYEDKNVS
eukprot:TRINITY_DN2668_c0_g1_i1.p1 TRINITY_DN2668_c0_g1~~TRINITY_DN2668_c0_g1_i1.p1  ORF type:complete len:118 (-),score=2.29 TRINITY_DN2668_c0_g1_i1:246-599(-)